MPIPAETLDALRQNEVSLTTLDLSGTQLTDADILRLMEALAQNHALTSLNLELNQIGAEGARGLAQNHTLTSLNLGSNQIGDEGARALAQNHTLTSLDLNDNQIGDAGARALAQNHTLTSLNLGSNQIGDAGVRALAQNNTLTSLDLSQDLFSVSQNQIGDTGAQALAQNHTLTSLNLYYNQIGDTGARALAQNNTLTSLDVVRNQIGTAGARALAQNHTLTSLHVSQNQIGAEGEQALAQNGTLLQGVGFALNSANPSQAHQFLAACGSGDVQAVQTLLEQQQVSPYTFGQDSGRTGWHRAVAEGQIAVMLFLLLAVPNPQSLFIINQENDDIFEISKETDSSTLYLKAARAIESYSNATIRSLLAKHPLTSSASSSRLFAPPISLATTACPSSSLASVATITTVTADEAAAGSISLEALEALKL